MSGTLQVFGSLTELSQEGTAMAPAIWTINEAIIPREEISKPYSSQSAIRDLWNRSIRKCVYRTVYKVEKIGIGMPFWEKHFHPFPTEYFGSVSAMHSMLSIDSLSIQVAITCPEQLVINRHVSSIRYTAETIN